MDYRRIKLLAESGENQTGISKESHKGVEYDESNSEISELHE